MLNQIRSGLFSAQDPPESPISLRGKTERLRWPQGLRIGSRPPPSWLRLSPTPQLCSGHKALLALELTGPTLPSGPLPGVFFPQSRPPPHLLQALLEGTSSQRSLSLTTSTKPQTLPSTPDTLIPFPGLGSLVTRWSLTCFVTRVLMLCIYHLPFCTRTRTPRKARTRPVHCCSSALRTEPGSS